MQHIPGRGKIPVRSGTVLGLPAAVYRGSPLRRIQSHVAADHHPRRSDGAGIQESIKDICIIGQEVQAFCPDGVTDILMSVSRIMRNAKRLPIYSQ